MKKLMKKQLRKKARRLEKKIIKNKISAWKLRIIERDNWTCQVTNKKLLTRRQCNPHHIISLNSVLRKYPELLEDDSNGILLSAYAHRFASDSAHQSPLEFTLWLKENKPKQFEYLVNFIKEHKKIVL